MKRLFALKVVMSLLLMYLGYVIYIDVYAKKGPLWALLLSTMAVCFIASIGYIIQKLPKYRYCVLCGHRIDGDMPIKSVVCSEKCLDTLAENIRETKTAQEIKDILSGG